MEWGLKGFERGLKGRMDGAGGPPVEMASSSLNLLWPGAKISIKSRGQNQEGSERWIPPTKTHEIQPLRCKFLTLIPSESER